MSAMFEHRAAVLRKNLVHRRNVGKFVHNQIHRAWALDRDELLAVRQETTNKRLPFVVTYYPGLPNIGGILRVTFLLHTSNRCIGVSKPLKICPRWHFIALRAWETVWFA